MGENLTGVNSDICGEFFGDGVTGKEKIISDIKLKLEEALYDSEYYGKALEKIHGLEYGKFYEITRDGDRGDKYLVMVQRLGRDSVWVRVYAADGKYTTKDLLCDYLNLPWGWSWTYRRVGIEDFPLYMDWVRTKWFDKVFTSNRPIGGI